MSGSLTDMLAPEAQHLLGAGAITLALTGAVLWFAGIKIARAAVATFTGSVTAALAAWLLPNALGIAPLTAAFAGFAIGAFLGALAFRLLQGITLALCLGLAVAGGYYRWHVNQIETPPPATAAATDQSVPASDLLIQGPLIEPTATQAARAGTEQLSAFTRKLADRWNAIDQKHQRRMLAAGIGTAAVVLLLAFGFARHTTWVVTALLGTAMLFSGAEAATHIFAPNFQSLIPAAFLFRYALMALIAALGMLLQRLLFWPRKRKPGDAPPPQPRTGMGPSSS